MKTRIEFVIDSDVNLTYDQLKEVLVQYMDEIGCKTYSFVDNPEDDDFPEDQIQKYRISSGAVVKEKENS